MIAGASAPRELRKVLADVLGETVVVRNTRAIHLIGTIHIHLDRVEGTGEFMEVEVVLEGEQDSGQGEAIAADLLRRFGIRGEDLVATAYADLLERPTPTSRCVGYPCCRNLQNRPGNNTPCRLRRARLKAT